MSDRHNRLLHAAPHQPLVHRQRPPAAPPKTYRPPAPNPTDFDWVRLTSGEWLKGDITLMREEITAWQKDRNNRGAPINWQFTTDTARIKLARLYPKL